MQSARGAPTLALVQRRLGAVLVGSERGKRVLLTQRFKPRPGKAPCLPPAKTKRYMAEEPRWMAPEDVRELLWRRQAYNTALASIRAMFKQQLEESGGRLGIDEDIQELEEEDAREFQRLREANKADNDRLAQVRAAREEADAAAMAADIRSAVEAHLEQSEATAAVCLEELRRVQAQVDDMLTPDNLKWKIVEALEAPVDYNAPIDSLGIEYHTTVPLHKYLESPLTADTRQLYRDKPLPLVYKDEEVARKKREEAGLSPIQEKEPTRDIISAMDGS